MNPAFIAVKEVLVSAKQHNYAYKTQILVQDFANDSWIGEAIPRKLEVVLMKEVIINYM